MSNIINEINWRIYIFQKAVGRMPNLILIGYTQYEYIHARFPNVITKKHTHTEICGVPIQLVPEVKLEIGCFFKLDAGGGNYEI